MGDNLNRNTTINKTKRNVAQTAIIMAILTLVSKLLGFVREMVIAGFFGTSYIVDAYVMAQTIPGMLFGGIFSSIGTAYLPAFSKINEEKGTVEGNRFTSQIINVATLFAFCALIIGIVFADSLVGLIARDFPKKTAELTSFYLKITFGYTIFTSSINMLDKYLQYKGSFLQPIMIGYLQNIGVIVGAMVAAYTSHYYLALGFLCGYAIRFVAILCVSLKRGFKYSFDFHFGEPVRQIAVLSVPVFIGSSISQLNSLIDKSLASSLQEGSVAALNYSYLLITLITGLTSSIIATIMYPKITKALNEGNWDFFNTAVEKALMAVLIIGVPFGIGAMAFSDEVVQVVYERGAFDSLATNLTSSAFFYYSIGLPFIAINSILTYVYYSMRDMKTPIVCSIIGVTFNIVLNIILVGYMEHRGLALATSIASVINIACLFVAMKRHSNITIFKSKINVIKVVMAAILAVALAKLFYNCIVTVMSISMIISLGLAVLLAIVVYIWFLVILKIEETKFLFDLFKRVY